MKKKGMILLADNRYPQRRIIPEQNANFGIPNPSESVPAMLYVPWQTDVATYDEMKAFEKGTLFSALDKPFYGKRCK